MPSGSDKSTDNAAKIGKHECHVIFANRLIAVFFHKACYNDTLSDPSIVLQNSSGGFYHDLTAIST